MIINRVPVRLLCSLESSKDHLSHPCHSENTIRVIVVVFGKLMIEQSYFRYTSISFAISSFKSLFQEKVAFYVILRRF